MLRCQPFLGPKLPMEWEETKAPVRGARRPKKEKNNGSIKAVP